MTGEWAILQPMVGDMSDILLVVKKGNKLRCYNQDGSRDQTWEDDLENDPHLDDFKSMFTRGWTYYGVQLGELTPENIKMLEEKFEVDLATL